MHRQVALIYGVRRRFCASVAGYLMGMLIASTVACGQDQVAAGGEATAPYPRLVTAETRGDDHFNSSFEPWRDWGRYPPPGYMFLYT